MKKRMRLGASLFLFIVTICILGMGMRATFAERVSLTTYHATTDADRYMLLPFSGANFEAGSILAYGVGRYYLKGKTAATIISAYEMLAHTHPDRQFVYAEMGWKGGGRFRPHRTHRQGLSADFMTPVYTIDATGNRQPAILPTHTLNLWGYHIRLDANGHFKNYQMDSVALIAHIAALQEAGKRYGIQIKQVILDPPLLKILQAEPTFTTLDGIKFMNGKAWFPHDGHYHIDFQEIK